jgi:uncharacterized repeat protein (TIGR01451 family)
LEVGTQVSLTYTIAPTQTGLVTVAVSVTASTPDPAPANNNAVRTLVVGVPLSLDKTMIVQISANDMVWSPSLGKLLLTSSNSAANWAGGLISVDPNTLAVQFEAAIGSDAGRLTTSRDDTVLYAGVDFGVSALPMSTLDVTNRFVVRPDEGRYYAYDLESVPGSNQIVIVGGKSRTSNSTWLSEYDQGIQRSNIDSFNSTGLSLEFGNDASVLYSKDYSANGFRRYAVNSQGITLLDTDTSLLPTSTVMDLVWGAGRIYTSIGRVINPFNRSLIGSIAGILTGSRVRYDSPSGHVFFLSPGTNQATLRAFDGSSLLPVGSRTLPGVTGSLTSFVRWGLDGFAATTTSGQLVLFRSSLVATNPPADVSLFLLQNGPYFAGSNVVTSIMITNSGPNSATDVLWNNGLPNGAVVLNATTSMGTVGVVSNTVSGTIPLLSIGTAAIVNVTFRVPSAGIVTNQASVTASSIDSVFSNNVAAALLWIQPAGGLTTVLSVTLPVKDLERDPNRPLLYASFGSSAGALADSVIPLDPINGNIGAPVRVGSNPGLLTASADGQFLYVALDGAGLVQKLALPSLTPISSFAVPQNQTVTRMVVSPMNSDVVAIRRTPGARTSLHIAGVKLPGELTDQDLFAFSENSGQLFGCDGVHSNVKMYRLNTASNGLTRLESQAGKQSSSIDLKSSGGLLFFNRGLVLNPDTTRVRAIMPVPIGSVVEPDMESGRVFYLTPAGSVWTLRAFDVHQGIEVGSVSLPTLASAPRKLVRWGADGLAFYNTNSQVIFLRGQLVPTNPPIELVLKQSFSALTATTNDNISVSIEVTNLGPVNASGVVITQTFSLPISNVNFVASSGSASFSNGTAVWQAGNVANGAGASLTMTLRALQPGTLNISAKAYHTLNDTFWGNNTAFGAVEILHPSVSNILQLQISSRDLLYDSSRNVIYASTPASSKVGGNLIVVIDPATGEIKRTLLAGSEPNQLALASDDSFLYVAVNGAAGVQRFNLQSYLPDLSFSLGSEDFYYSQDLEVQPGKPQTVAASLGSYNWASGYPSDVILYDDGIWRTNKGGPADGLTFSTDGLTLFGFVSPGYGNGCVRMWPDTEEFRTDVVGGFSTVPGDLKFSNGRVYSYSGQVLDPYAPALIGSFSASGPQAVDSSAGRAFYLAQNGSSWELRAFDLGTLQSVGTQTVANVQGTPANLLRCGGDRLAFGTSSNQVFIVRTQLVPTNTLSPANLAVTQTGGQEFNAEIETLRFVISITNRGSGVASNVVTAIKPPSTAASVSLELPQGTSTNSGANYLCNLGSIPPGQSVDLVLRAVITNTATYSNFVSVSSGAPDPDLSDNRSLAIIHGSFFQRPSSVQIYPISARALAYDRVRQRLFAALTPVGTTNLIGWFDPATGAQQGSMPVGFAPTSMLVTEDSQYLYLAGNTGLVQRIQLQSLTMDLGFTPPAASLIAAISLIPGSPHSVALSFWSSNGPTTGIFDDGISRPDQVSGMFTLLTPASDGSALFGYANTGTGGNSPDVFRMSVSSLGLQMLDNGPSDTPWGNQVQMNYFTNRLFFANGAVLNPSTWTEEQSFQLGSSGVGLDFIPAINGAAFLTIDDVSSSTAHLLIHSIGNRQQLAKIDVRFNSLGFGNLTYCGADRFAFRSGSEIAFIRSSAIPASDVVLRGGFSTNQIMIGESVDLQLLVSNAGPYAVSGVFLTNIVPPEFNVLSVTSSQGALTTNGTVIINSIGTLNTNVTASLNVVLSPMPGALGIGTNKAQAWGSNLADPIPFNNSIDNQLLVLPRDTDRDGIPDDWELAHGLNPSEPADALMDADCDGTLSLQEYLAGTDPFVFDGLRIIALTVNANVGVITAHGALGVTYQVDTSTNLTEWRQLATFVCHEKNQKVSFPLTAAPASFFRLQTTTNLPVPFLAIDRASIVTNRPVLQVVGPPHHRYYLQSSTNLITWVDITNFRPATCATWVQDPTTSLGKMRFYRARVE